MRIPPKITHEIRDPIHVFVRLDTDERKVLDSRPFQRLRHIHQLAMTYLVYPGATHRRFEHSLGVMELASRVFDVVTRPENVTDDIRRLLPQIAKSEDRTYWRRVLRMAALCHDLGHLPFSHAAEASLLPNGSSHEDMSAAIIRSDEMNAIWREMTPPLRPEDVVKVALGPQEAPKLDFSIWEAILAEIIVGDAFGVDRMDYLLRDSHHIGVAYGKFDHFRLIDTLRILPTPVPETEQEATEPALGVEEGGIQSAEALLIARYLMYSQVYFHHVRRMYDMHLRDFLASWLPGGLLPTDVSEYCKMTDNEVTAGILAAARDPSQPGHEAAKSILDRPRFKVLYQRNPNDVAVNPEAGQAVMAAAQERFARDKLRHDRYSQKSGAPDFPVLRRDGAVVSSFAVSEALKSLPVAAIDYVLADQSVLQEATKWLQHNHDDLIKPQGEDDNG